MYDIMTVRFSDTEQCFNPFSAGTVLIGHNLTSVDVRLYKDGPALKELKYL